ncbi:MAG: hypothetical protein IJ595_11265 [Oscillospiraceae bacterium]|nr:hypothetical protein [Oscillospiraceae bacterium]
MLRAIGKTIDTLPLAALFSQEEKYADTVQIQVDRFYDAHDLSEFIFLLRGVTDSGGETECILDKTVGEDTVTLTWRVGQEFTTEPGTLRLDLAAMRYAEGADPSEDPPEAVLRYQMPPVQVRPLPDAMHTLDTQSYTVFLMQVRAAATEGIAEMTALTEEFADKIDSYDTQLASLTNRATAVERRTTALESAQSETEDDLADLRGLVVSNRNYIVDLKEKVDPMPDIRVLTQAQYDALVTKDSGTVYCII